MLSVAPPRGLTSNLQVSPVVIEISAAITGTEILLDPQQRPFTVFNIHVRSGSSSWSIKKKFEAFHALAAQLHHRYHIQIPLSVPNPPNVSSSNPSAAAQQQQQPATVPADFAQELKIGLQTWLRRLLRDPQIVKTDEIHAFLESSDSGDPLPPEIQGGGFDTSNTDSSSSSRGISGVKLEDFTLLKVIGKGSFGKVLQVRKIDTGEIFAMKVLKKESIIKRNQVEHTKTERNVLEYIHHPFVVSLRYAFQTKSKLYFVLDYCPGGELFFHLGKMGKFSENLAKFYAAQIVLALEYLHNLGIVYRDLKPENVLLTGEGNIALTDFGLSKEGIVDNVSAHSFCGTPEYLAPEILNRSGHGRAADWWSLGALLYEMLTGMPPFYSRDRERLFQKILKSELQFPRFVSNDAKGLLKGLLTRDASERLGSSKFDAQEIKSHPFFADIDFDAMLAGKIPAPFKPVIAKGQDGVDETNNFDSEFTNLPVVSPDHNNSTSIGKSVGTGKFAGFTFINPQNLPIATADSVSAAAAAAASSQVSANP